MGVGLGGVGGEGEGHKSSPCNAGEDAAPRMTQPAPHAKRKKYA